MARLEHKQASFLPLQFTFAEGWLDMWAGKNENICCGPQNLVPGHVSGTTNI